MSTKPDPWAKEWLERKRQEAPDEVRGWTLEKHGDVHYIKWGTTEWDSEAKKYRKKSKHIGRLNRNGTITPARPHATSGGDGPLPTDIKEYGNAVVLEKASEKIYGPLKDSFGDSHAELLAMAMLRVMENPRLNHASDSWRLIEDTRGMNPRMSEEVLSVTLEGAGGALSVQNRFFEAIDEDDRHMAVDLSVVFSKSSGMRMLRKGYNRFRSRNTQFNLSTICNVKTGRPCRLCMVCGNVKENSVIGMLDEFGIDESIVLIMDRAYAGKTLLGKLKGKGHDFVVALRRDSEAYKEVSVGEGHFVFEDRAIEFGTGDFWGFYAYRYQDLSMRADEIYDKYKAETDKGIEPRNVDRAGNIMLLSSMKLDPREIFRMYKCRCSIENFFDTMKNDLGGDTTYLRTDNHVMGYNFVTFLAFCIWWEIRSWLEAAGLEGRYTPKDVLRSFAAVKVCHTDKGMLVPSIPKDVRDLSAKLGIDLKEGYIPQKS